MNGHFSELDGGADRTVGKLSVMRVWCCCAVRAILHLRIPRRIAFLSIYKSGHHGVRTGSSAQLSGWSIADPADAPSGLRIMWGGSVKQAHVARRRRARGRHHALPQPQDRARAHAALRRGTFGAADDRGAVRVRRYDGGPAVGRGGHGEGGVGDQPRRRQPYPRWRRASSSSWAHRPDRTMTSTGV